MSSEVLIARLSRWSSRVWGGSPVSRALLAALCLASVAGCREDEPEPAETKAVPENKPVIDQKIESAMAAAQKSVESSAGKGAELQPPEDGILDAAAAEREVPAGSAAVIVFGSAGSDPKLSLGKALSAQDTLPSGQLELSYRSGNSVMPTVEFELKPKAAASATGDIATRFLFANAGLAQTQPGRLPENARAEIAKLKGSAVEFVTTARGAPKSSRYTLEGNHPGLVPLVMGSAETLASVVLPYPEQPVGSGAFWMVKSRETANGAEVLAYRMVKVTSVSADTANLEVATRRYLLTKVLPIQSLPPHQVRQFESQGKATLSLQVGAAYPAQAEVEDTFMAIVSLNDRPNQGVPVQSEVRGKVRFGG